MGTVASTYIATPQQRPVVMIDRKDRRRKRRVALLPMYTAVEVRVLSSKAPPLEGHVVDLSESGIAVEVDKKIKPGSAVTVEFTVSGLGRLRDGQWPKFAATAEVLRQDDLEDFPQGPYKTAMRFIRLPSIIQAQISRYITANPAETARA